MWLAARLVPGLAFTLPARNAVAGAMGGAGFVVVVLAVVRFLRAKTSLNPLDPAKATSLVTVGIYRVTRNPMYLGLLLLLGAWGLFLANAIALAALPFYVGFMNRFQIVPEEVAMARTFGPAYADYQRQVRRWL
jgi:protein-S-isoprenylcysteine O-methyltransferase Ste14